MTTRKNRQHDSGQALTELVASMIGLMLVFLGLLFVAALGLENVECLVEARGRADLNAASGIAGFEGKSIQEWDYGTDGLQFTADDAAVTGCFGNAALYADELKSTDSQIDLATDLAPVDELTSYRFPEHIPPAMLFLSAAQLSAKTVTVPDPLSNRNLESLEGAFRALISGTNNFGIKETVFMPIIQEETF